MWKLWKKNAINIFLISRLMQIFWCKTFFANYWIWLYAFSIITIRDEWFEIKSNLSFDFTKKRFWFYLLLTKFTITQWFLIILSKWNILSIKSMISTIQNATSLSKFNHEIENDTFFSISSFLRFWHDTMIFVTTRKWNIFENCYLN